MRSQGTGGPKKRGRKRKGDEVEAVVPKEQEKFFIDVSKDKDAKEMILGVLRQANSKSFGREILLRDLVLIALPKLAAKDFEKIQEASLTEMERVERALEEHNRKAGTTLSLGEFLVRRLGV